MKKLKIDYKGKWFVLQDEVWDDAFETEIGEIDDEDITDEFLEEHIENCMYYGIPEYVGKDENLIKRIYKIRERLIIKLEIESGN